jgi:hypothetical protein
MSYPTWDQRRRFRLLVPSQRPPVERARESHTELANVVEAVERQDTLVGRGVVLLDAQSPSVRTSGSIGAVLSTPGSTGAVLSTPGSIGAVLSTPGSIGAVLSTSGSTVLLVLVVLGRTKPRPLTKHAPAQRVAIMGPAQQLHHRRRR